MNHQALSDHWPARALNRAEFRRWIQESDLLDVLPSKMSESLLLGLARELRVATGSGSRRGVGRYRSPPILMVTRLLAEGGGQVNAAPRNSPLDEDDLLWALHVLQFAIDKEIVSRIVGVGGERLDEFLLAALHRPAQGRSHATNLKPRRLANTD